MKQMLIHPHLNISINICVDQIFTLKQIGENVQEKKCRVYVDFIDLEKACDGVIRKLCGRS